MTGFLVAAAALTLVLLSVLLRPLLRQRRPGGEDRDEPVTALFRRQLAAIDQEIVEGRLSPAEGEVARAEVTRRLLAAAERENGAAAGVRGGDSRWRFAAAVGIGGVLPAAALAIYFSVGAPSALERSRSDAAAGVHGEAELATDVDRLQAHLRQSPEDLKGWTLLGRTLAALSRFPGALDAYNHALALSPADPGLHAEFGEVLVLEAQGVVTPDAEAQFAKAPDDPRSRYYMAEAALQKGDPEGAKRRLQALLADAPADAPWRQTVADRLAELSPSGAVGAGTAAASGATQTAGAAGATAAKSGPSAADVAAAAALTPEQRETMIRAMVEQLAQRLEQHPDDKTGWERLAHAYDVLGEPDKAAAARARATAATSAASSPAASASSTPPGAAPVASAPAVGR
jgi:cytochrome c-type biogenesis protein CcmH